MCHLASNNALFQQQIPVLILHSLISSSLFSVPSQTVELQSSLFPQLINPCIKRTGICKNRCRWGHCWEQSDSRKAMKKQILKDQAGVWAFSGARVSLWRGCLRAEEWGLRSGNSESWCLQQMSAMDFSPTQPEGSLSFAESTTQLFRFLKEGN